MLYARLLKRSNFPREDVVMRCDISRLGFIVCTCVGLGLASTLAPARADAPAPAEIERDAQNDGGAAGVLGKLPKDFVVHAVGTYGAQGNLAVHDLNLDDSGHEV